MMTLTESTSYTVPIIADPMYWLLAKPREALFERPEGVVSTLATWFSESLPSSSKWRPRAPRRQGLALPD
jgi:hypothetical protein